MNPVGRHGNQGVGMSSSDDEGVRRKLHGICEGNLHVRRTDYRLYS